MDKLAYLMLQFSEACISTRTVAEVCELVERIVVSLGVERFALAGLPLPHESLESYFHLNGWPPAWFERYLRKNYFRDDPVVNLVRRADRAIVWSETIDNQALPPKARQVMREAADFGLVDGITIPIFTRSGFAGIFSVAGKKVSLPAPHRDLLHIIAIRAYTRLRDLNAAGSDITEDVMVTRSESECLTWCVEGKKDWEIGEMTRRSPRTVQTHLTNLQQKLNARNRAHLIAEAFRRGLQR
ncbi:MULTISPECIES: LuxR family transcriptional regulator [Rhizobium/Agrobacterium group]|uniref:LuxR family transcriptional regulator n=2 Tax=Neorhizobium TaxID=1525371 RepID=A0ABV0M310_9HYPH|nr:MULTISPECIES: LuxR family transcriptional regulator [Rhizobium/Agrobacterium group]KGD99580.1 response regulator [Rhizobium sp. YS-1r]MCC2609505.1 LuxR family transcriptional regulator [Neorhizobium petrolearium]WGI69712.1 LuxR family transcriptional regulator [Neorhizobium petrolearium]